MSRNDCVTEKTFETYQTRVRSWPSLLKVVDTVVDTSQVCVDEDLLRIFTRDAERTVEDPARRCAYINALSLVHRKFGDYHQGGGYICAFLSIFLSREDLARVMWFLDESTTHHHGYYKGEPQIFVADAMVLNELTRIYFPKLLQHLEKVGFAKDNTHMYCVKWFAGLGLHMMPFSTMFSFIELFLLNGREFLFQFSMAYFQELETAIMSNAAMNLVNALLRNEHIDDHKKAHPSISAWPEVKFFEKVLRNATLFDLDSKVDFRDLLEKEHARYAETVLLRRARMDEMKKKDMESDDEIVFSDEED